VAVEVILPDVWFALLGFILFLAVVLDGFDLGVGIISLLARDENRRDILMSSIGPVWHANLTWLVVLGGLLFGAFPLAYGIILPALYIPLVVMLFGLILRGVSLEFRQEARRQGPWSLAFGWSSLVAAASQGLVVGGFLSGITVQGSRFAGSVWDWLNPFATLVALALVSGYVLLGAAYLILKTSGEVQLDSYRHAQAAAWSLLLLGAGVGLWAIFKYPFMARKWFVGPAWWLTTLPAALAGLSWIMVLFSLLRLKERGPFFWSLLLFFWAFWAMAASLHPYVVPPAVTAQAAAAPALTLKVMAMVVGVLLPVMLIYNGYQYLVFRGKATGAGYGESGQ
jgi:cytochrome d ubiquinol oxidase subunit II